MNSIIFPPHHRLCYYPSCNHETPWILMRLDCDLFVMSDKSPRATQWVDFEKHFKKHKMPIDLVEESAKQMCFKSGEKTVYVFREDNRRTLERLAHQGLNIHHFVGICDGCAEGGNHECVHERPFMSHVLAIAENGMRYTTDHSYPLQQGYGFNRRVRKFLERVYWCDFPPPEYPNNRIEPESKQYLDDHIAFELQGVLVRENNRLLVLPKGPHATSLDVLKPFRSIYYRQILAEYRVFMG